MSADFEVIRADPSRDATLRYLLEFYFHDLAEWFQFDQQLEGNYADNTEEYWTGDTDVYLLYIKGIPVGFSIVGVAEKWLPGAGARDMTEFFVVRRHRNSGIGRKFAAHVWSRYPGPWLVRVFRANEPALPFWRKVIAEYAAGRQEEKAAQTDSGEWSYFVFEAGGRARTTLG